MSQLTFSDLIGTPVPLSAEEAVALTLGVAELLAAEHASTLPSDDEIILSSTGHVSFLRADDAPGNSGVLLVAQLASLTRRLLQLDRTPADSQHPPAALRLALARAMGESDLPAPSLDEFRAALEAIERPAPTTLAAVFWRAARLRACVRPQLVALPAVKVESALARGADERRHNQPAASELRRYLRETERELYEARQLAPIVAVPIVRPPAARRPLGSGRVWRVSMGIAATAVGAVLGTVMAFTLAGSAERPADGTPVPMAEAVPTLGIDPAASHGALQARVEHPIPTERSVQPLLLAAAVGADVFSPSFDRRGRAILFHTGREAAPLMRASFTDTGEVDVDRIETLLDDGAANYHVTMSPDGTTIAYDSDRDGVRGVYVANADGSKPRRISGTGYAAIPSWSPDGRRVAFVREEPKHERVWNLWFADVPTGKLRRVTNHTLGQPWGASWFPDGDRLAYSLEDRLMVADLTTGLARGYRSPREGRLVRTPAVSPDGRRIVFQVQRDGVWLLDLEKARMRRILSDATAEEFVWMPDGTSIAYHAKQSGAYGLFRYVLAH